MEDITTLLQRDLGLKPQGKSAPMGGSKSMNTNTSNFNFNFNTSGSVNHVKSSALNTDDIFGTNQSRNTHSSDFNNYDDVFGGPPQYKSPSPHTAMGYDDIFQDFSAPAASKSSPGPVYDAPRYDDDIFGGVHGVKNTPSMPFHDVFSGTGSASSGPAFDDLLGGFGTAEPDAKKAEVPPPIPARGESVFDDLLPGFGKSEPAKPRGTTDSKLQQPTDSSQKPANVPFVVLETDSFSSNASSATFHDPLEEFGILSNASSATFHDPLQEFGMTSESTNTIDRKGSGNGTVGFDDIFDGFPQAVPTPSSPIDNVRKDRSPLKTSQSSSLPQTNVSRESVESKSPRKESVNNVEKNHANLYSGPPVADFDLPSNIPDFSTKSTSNRNTYSMHEDTTFPNKLNTREASPPRKPDNNVEFVDDIWITVDEVQLFTQPTLAPPPERVPPPLVIKQGPSKSSRAAFDSDKPSVISSIDELEVFAMGRSRGYAQQQEDVSSYDDDIDGSSAAAASAAAMREAMDKAEVKLKMAKKMREREKESGESERQEKEERPTEEVMEHEEKERVERAAQEAREREESERESRERERLRIERERERDRIAVERATKEARERAAIGARDKQQRAAVERATKEARDRAAAEARERAERASFERAAAEARERAAAEARERAAAEARERAERAAVERAAAEARERAAAEARQRAAAERAAVDRAAAEVRLRAERAAVERATAEVRERAAERASAERSAAARERQMRADNDLESFFSMGARANSAPRQRPPTPDSFSNAQSQNKGFSSEAPQRTSAGVPSGIRKASSAANIVDDWTTLFSAAPSSEDFQEVEGETEERRKARLERHQRTLERTAKALAEKNERDMQAQRDQAERQRSAETLDAEIKRWAVGKEGNLRALLSTMQYVLWPEAGWQPVSLTDVITGASVKKVYRKATLCVHPDKVQQKGATIQQKYIAEKVFDLLKEAWNKFNAEELF